MRALVISSSITRRDEKSLEKYLTEISRYDVLTPEEEVELFQRFQNGSEDALDKILKHNLRFVVSVAKQYQNLGLWLGDLINEGNIGLIKAARRFDTTRGFKFISYAVWWIRQSILQAINEKARKIRLPLNQQSNSTKIMRARLQLMQKIEREPTVEELAEVTEFSVDVIRKVKSNYKMCSSLNAPVDSDGETDLLSFLEDDSIQQPDYELSVHESREIEVKNLLNTLPTGEATVLSLYYGVDRKNPVTLTDIADTMGLTKERVRQIRDKGLKRLRRTCTQDTVAVTL